MCRHNSNDIRFDVLDGCFWSSVVPVSILKQLRKKSKPVHSGTHHRSFNMCRSNRFYHKEIRKWWMCLHFAWQLNVAFRLSFHCNGCRSKSKRSTRWMQDWCITAALFSIFFPKCVSFSIPSPMKLFESNDPKKGNRVENDLSLSFVRIN